MNFRLTKLNRAMMDDRLLPPGGETPPLVHRVQCPEFSLQFTPMDMDGHFHFLQTITNLRETPL